MDAKTRTVQEVRQEQKGVMRNDNRNDRNFQDNAELLKRICRW